jgi:hypothetical protein
MPLKRDAPCFRASQPWPPVSWPHDDDERLPEQMIGQLFAADRLADGDDREVARGAGEAAVGDHRGRAVLGNPSRPHPAAIVRRHRRGPAADILADEVSRGTTPPSFSTRCAQARDDCLLAPKAFDAFA